MRRPIIRIVTGLLAALAVLAGVLVYNTLTYRPEPMAEVAPSTFEPDTAAATDLLSRAVQVKTVSTGRDAPAFGEFLTFLEENFPGVHGTLERVVLEPNTPLYKWTGRDPDLQPVLLAAHYDVVPVALDTLDEWVHPPFSGAVADGYVWGRGTLDNKGALIAIMTTAEQLIADGFTPERTVYFSFGGDEEIGGTGALAVANYLTDTGVRLAWALDEGSFVLDKIIPGLDVPVASINLSEKGYMTMTLVARSAGGHSSMPPRVTAVTRLARALNRLGETPVPGGLTGVSAEFFDGLGRYFSFDKRLLFANTWLFRPVLEGVLSGSTSTDAMLRTTTAPTMLHGSPKENVLATQASAVVNFRLHPRDSVEDVVAHVRKTVDDEQIEIIVDTDTASEASPVSSATAEGYLDIRAAIGAAFGPLATVPGLTIAATDARHYALAADNTYRIDPFKITGDDLTRFHGLNERLSVENLERGMVFYGALLQMQ